MGDILLSNLARAARLSAIGLATFATLLQLSATAAHAEDGTLQIVPATGVALTPITVVTSGPCPAGDFVVVKVSGHGFPEAGANVVAVSAVSIYPKASGGGFELPLQNHLHAFAEQQKPPAVLKGKYELVATCKTKLGSDSLGDFRGSLWFTSPTEYRNTDPAKPGSAAAVAPPTSSSAPSGTAAAKPGGALAPSQSGAAASPSAQTRVLGAKQSNDSAKSGGGGVLAYTGAELARLVLIAGLMLALGTAAVRFGRRRGYFTFGGR